ncbi:MAG: hypothetical protein R3E53_11035 [Myxococcota bacterium]
MLLIVPGVYLAIAYQMAMPLVIERGLGLWDALETSRKAITHCWFRYLLVLLVAVAGLGAELLDRPFGIGAIWALPFFTLSAWARPLADLQAQRRARLIGKGARGLPITDRASLETPEGVDLALAPAAGAVVVAWRLRSMA